MLFTPLKDLRICCIMSKTSCFLAMGGRAMNKYMRGVCACLLFLYSCSPFPAFLPDDEPAGSAAFFVNNSTGSEISVKMYLVEQLGGGVETALVAAQSRAQVFEDSIIGVNPQPADSFSKVELYAGDTLLFTHAPVDNGAWEFVQISTGAYYHAEFTLNMAMEVAR
jgi:hypothetical protein